MASPRLPPSVRFVATIRRAVRDLQHGLAGLLLIIPGSAALAEAAKPSTLGAKSGDTGIDVGLIEVLRGMTWEFAAALVLVCGALCAVAWLGLRRRRHVAANHSVTVPVPSASREAAAVIRAAPVSPLDTRDPEFLPPALEILVRPPSPITMTLMTTISVATLLVIVWSYFGWLDIHAVATGKIQPSGRSKVVQPVDTGKVVAVHTENGGWVNEGDVLIELDSTESIAERDLQRRDLEVARAEVARRRTVLAAADKQEFEVSQITFPTDISEALRVRETLALRGDLAQLRANLDGLRAQIAEKHATKQRLADNIAARERLLALAQERVDMKVAASQKGASSRAHIIDVEQQLETQRMSDVSDRGLLIEAEAARASLEKRVDQTLMQFKADQISRLLEIEQKRERLEQEVVKATSRSSRSVLIAPISGTVQQLAVSTQGQVVTTGQHLMTIVPANATLEVEALIANKDIGFVKVGQKAVVKVEAFPFTRYGVIYAEVVKVTTEAVDDRDASVLNDAAAAARPQPGTAGQALSRNQTLVFPATLKLSQREMQIDGEAVPLNPGMAVTVEIRTGQRRAIDYVLSPLRETGAQFGHER